MSLDNFLLKSIFVANLDVFMLKPCNKNDKHTFLILAPRKDCAILPKVHIFRGRSDGGCLAKTHGGRWKKYIVMLFSLLSGKLVN